MLLFVICLGVLYFLTLLDKRKPEIFIKEKSIPLKGILSILIVMHHISLLVDTNILFQFRYWGVPVVSLFFFISGYGLMKSYLQKGEIYLVRFLFRRVLATLFLPFAIACIVNRIINWAEVPDLFTTVNDLLEKGITVLPNSWFIYNLLLFYFVFYVAAKYLKNHIIFVAISFVIGYMLLLEKHNFPLHWWVSSMAFPCGLYFAKHEGWFLNKWNSPVLYNLTVPLWLFIVAICVMLRIKLIYTLVYVILPLIVVCLLSKIKIEKLNNVEIVRFLSNISYEVYLYHGIWIFLLLDKVKSNVIFVIVVYILTFILSYFMNKTKLLLFKFCR